jgi:ABC-2 type transport system permease protein
MISWSRVYGFLLRHLYQMKASLDRKADILFWPVIDVLTFGLLTVYIGQMDVGQGVAGSILGGLMLWVLVYTAQREIPLVILEDAWSRNLYNLLSTPIKPAEIMLGSLILSAGKAVITATVVMLLAWSLFNFTLFGAGFALLFMILNIFVFGWSVGFFTSYLIFRFGTKVQIVAWSLIALIFPVSGVFYPIETLPGPLQQVAQVLPISYVFEGLRMILIEERGIPAKIMFIIMILNAFYLVIGIAFYLAGFKNAKTRGWFIHPS